MLKFIPLILINAYWKVIPPEKRRTCLFKESCSRYVHRKFKEDGVLSGIRACVYRFRNCKNEYELIDDGYQVFVQMKNGEKVDASDINPFVLEGLKYKK